MPAESGEVLTDSLQVVSGLHLGRAHLHKGVADLVQHLNEKGSIRNEGKAAIGTAGRGALRLYFFPRGPGWGEGLSLLIHPTSQSRRAWDGEWQPTEHSPR